MSFETFKITIKNKEKYVQRSFKNYKWNELGAICFKLNLILYEICKNINYIQKKKRAGKDKLW